MHFRTKDAYVNAEQWHKNGDHSKDNSVLIPDGHGGEILSEGELVKRFFHSVESADVVNTNNGFKWKDHGWIEAENVFQEAYKDFGLNTMNGQPGLLVSPGDWIIAENPTRVSGDKLFYRIYKGKNFLAEHECYEAPKKEDIERLKARFLWNVNYNGREYPVYDFENRFNMQTSNGNVNHWWVLWGNEFHPYGDRHTHRTCHTFVFKEYNSAKIKWDEMRTSRGIHVTILANDKAILNFTVGGDMGYAMARAQYMIVKMQEHSYNFYKPEENQNRPIYYYNLPARIRNKSEPGEIAIIPDYVEGWDKKSWWKEYYNRSTRKPYLKSDIEDFEMEKEDFEESQQQEYINWGSALSDQNIYWHRNEDKKTDQDPSANLSAGTL